MIIKVLYFGIYRDLTKKEYEKVELDEEADTASLLKFLKTKYPILEKYPDMIISLNYRYCDKTCHLSENDEVAVMSPVSGG
ncbi:MAG: MoaD/ThiS family protein [Thermoplasmata archaeon]